MYSADQLLKGFQQPDRAKREIQRQFQKIQGHLNHDIGIQGSYWTTNVGDRAIGEILMERLSTEGYKVRLFPKDTEYSAAPIRILGGGGVLHDWYGLDHLRKRFNFLSDNGAIIGVGVPGFKTNDARKLVTERLSDIDLITVRDSRSREQLEPFYEGEIHTTACPALLHNDPKTSEFERTGVNFRPWYHLDPEVMSYHFDYDPNLDYSDAKKRYIENANLICEEVNNPVFIPFHKKDEEFAHKHLDVKVLPYEFSVNKTLERVSAVDQMVTMRYHALVFAIICNKPVLTINYDPKVSCLADRIGVSSYKPHSDIPILFESISNRNEVRKAAEKNFSLLSSHLEDRL